MKVYEAQKIGLDGLTLVESAIAEPGAGEVRVAMKAMSLNYRDLMTVKAMYGLGPRLPFVPMMMVQVLWKQSAKVFR